MGCRAHLHLQRGAGRRTRWQRTVVTACTGKCRVSIAPVTGYSASKAGKLELATKGANGLPLGGNGDILDARFWLLKY